MDESAWGYEEDEFVAPRQKGKPPPSCCTVDSIVVPRALWDRTVRVVERIQGSRHGQMGKLPLYCPAPMNRHGIDNLMNEIRAQRKG